MALNDTTISTNSNSFEVEGLMKGLLGCIRKKRTDEETSAVTYEYTWNAFAFMVNLALVLLGCYIGR